MGRNAYERQGWGRGHAREGAISNTISAQRRYYCRPDQVAPSNLPVDLSLQRRPVVKSPLNSLLDMGQYGRTIALPPIV